MNDDDIARVRDIVREEIGEAIKPIWRDMHRLRAWCEDADKTQAINSKEVEKTFVEMAQRFAMLEKEIAGLRANAPRFLPASEGQKKTA